MLRKYESIAEKLFEMSMELMLQDGIVYPVCFILKGNNIGVLSIPTDLWENSQVRSRTGFNICEQAQKRNADAVFLISEVWMITIEDSSENDLQIIPSEHEQKQENLLLFYMEAEGTQGILAGQIFRHKEGAFVKDKSWLPIETTKEFYQGLLHPWKGDTT